MDEAHIINTASQDPVVIRARSTSRPDGSSVPPNPGALLAAATTELEALIADLLGEEVIARALLEKEHALSLSTGGTDVQQGTWFVVPPEVGLMTAFTIGTTRKPVALMTSREEFNRWWYYGYGEQDVSRDAQVVIQWDETALKKRTILISPGVGSDTTIYILHRRRVDDFSLNNLEDEDHHVVLLGLKNRLSGGRFTDSYASALNRLKNRVPPISHEPTPMRRDKRVERMACVLNRLYDRGDQYSSRVYPSSP